MGGKSSTDQTQTAQASPYAPAAAPMNDILGKIGAQAGSAGLNETQTGALNQLKTNYSAVNPYAAKIGDVATGLLNGGGATANDSAMRGDLATYRGLLQPYASGSMIGGNTALKSQLDTMANDISGRINGQFAAAGRDFSGANQGAVARGISEGIAPVLASQYNTDTERALGAAGAGFNAGGQTYGMLNQTNQTANANRTAGVDVGSAALDANNWGANGLLATEAQRFGIPTSQYMTLLGAISPVAQAFGTNTSKTSGTAQMSGADQFAKIAGGIGSLWPKGNVSFGVPA